VSSTTCSAVAIIASSALPAARELAGFNFGETTELTALHQRSRKDTSPTATAVFAASRR